MRSCHKPEDPPGPCWFACTLPGRGSRSRGREAPVGCWQGWSGSSSLPGPTLLPGAPLASPRYSQATRCHIGREGDQPHPIDGTAACAREQGKASSLALPFGRGEERDLPNATQRVIRASNKMQGTRVPISLSSHRQGCLLPEALEGIVAHQSSVTTHVVSQLTQSLAKMVLEWAVSVQEGSPVLEKCSLKIMSY